MTHRTSIFFSVLFVLALASPIAFGALQLNFDASTQEKGDDSWTNSGEAGGSLPQADDKPDLEEGTIDIAALGASYTDKYYTATAARQGFTTPDNTPADGIPSFFTENYTQGILLNIRGGTLEEEHQLLGLQSDAPEANQTTRIWVDGGDPDGATGCLTNINVMQPAIGLREDYPTEDHGMCPGIGNWAFLNIAFESGIAITFYINGEVTGDLPSGVTWDAARPMNLHYIFAHSFNEQQRTFNGSIAFYKVWDEWMDEGAVNADISSEIGGGTAVESVGKLTTTWAAMRTQ
jgi:hypothetical protein